MNPKDEVDRLLAECGATLTRAAKHEVWLLPNGQKFTRGKTPSDARAAQNSLSDLKHALGVVKAVATNGARREKKPTNGAATPRVRYEKASRTLAEQLKDAGISDEALRDRISALETRLARMEYRQIQIEQRERQSWAYRFERWARLNVLAPVRAFIARWKS